MLFNIIYSLSWFIFLVIILPRLIGRYIQHIIDEYEDRKILAHLMNTMNHMDGNREKSFTGKRIKWYC